jgi:hypothetical protein
MPTESGSPQVSSSETDLRGFTAQAGDCANQDVSYSIGT